VVLAAVFVLGSAIYAATLVYPSYQAYSRARQTIEEKNRHLDDKKQMAATYARARQMTRTPFETQLPLPQSVSLPRTNLIAVTRQLAQMAESRHLDILGHTVHINGVTDQSRFIAMTVQLKGGWADFRAYLVDVMTLDTFSGMDGLHVYTDNTGTKYYTIDIRLWLEVQTS
jgi:argininosuccinate synthase